MLYPKSRCQCPTQYYWNEARLACELLQRRHATNGPRGVRGATWESEEISRWDAWTSWSDCSNTCGEGERVRRRSCRGYDPSACVGSATARKTCRDDSACYNKPLVYTVLVFTLVGFGIAIATVTMGKGDDPTVNAGDVKRAKKDREKRRKKKKMKRLASIRQETIQEASTRRPTARRETVRALTMDRPTRQSNLPRKSRIDTQSMRTY